MVQVTTLKTRFMRLCCETRDEDRASDQQQVSKWGGQTEDKQVAPSLVSHVLSEPNEYILVRVKFSNF